MNVARLLFTVVLVFTASAALANPITFVATLTGPGESPPNNSPGTGNATVTIDSALHTLTVSAAFANLLAPTTAAHIHCCTAPPGTAGVATLQPAFPGFPLGVTSGTLPQVTLDMTQAASYNAPFITANGGTTASAEAALFNGIATGNAYFNIHTAAPNGFPGGEIRGFLVTAVPEPSTIGLVGLGLGGLLALRRRRTVA
jgi:CHRD domain/PEP-CTERM motif